MPILNVRLAAILLVGSILVSGGVHAIHVFQVERYARALLKTTNSAEDDGRAALKKAEAATNPEEKKTAQMEYVKDLAEAIRLLRDYVRLSPNDHGEEIHLGELCAETQQLRAAYSYLDEGIRLAESEKPSKVTPEKIREARLKLIKEVALKTNDANILKAGQKHLTVLLDGAETRNRNRRPGEKPEGDPELLDLYGQFLAYLDMNEKDACDAYRDVILLAPDRVDSYMYLAQLLLRLNQESEADAAIESMLAKNPKSVAARENYFYYKMQRPAPVEDEKARKAYFDSVVSKAMQVLDFASDDSRALLLVGSIYLRKNDARNAVDYLSRGIKAAKNGYSLARAYKQLSDAQHALNKHDEALATLHQGIDATRGAPGCLALIWILADTQTHAQNYKDAEKNITELRAEGFSPPWVDFLEAQLAFSQQDWTKAERLLRDSVVPRLQDLPDLISRQILPASRIRYIAMLYLTKCYRVRGGDPNEQIILLQQATKLSPADYQAHAELADIYKRQGRLPLAAEQYSEALKGSRSEAAAVNLASTMISIQKQTPEDKRDWTPVEKLLEQLTADKSPRPELIGLRAELLLDQGRDNEAVNLLEACTKEAPKNANTWHKLVQLGIVEAEKQTDPVKKTEYWKRCDAYAEQAEKALGDCVSVRMIRGTLALARKDPQIEDVLKKLGQNTDALNASEKLVLWETLGNMSFAAGAFDLCRDYFRRLAELVPKDSLLPTRLCEVELRRFEMGRPVDMTDLDRLVDKLEQLNGDGPFCLYGKAVRAYIQAKDKDPNSLLEPLLDMKKVMRSRPDWPAPAVLAAKICVLLKQPALALDFYRLAIYMGDRSSDVVCSTVRLLAPQPYLDELLRGGMLQESDEEQLQSAKMLFGLLEAQKSPLLEEMHQEYVCVRAFCCDEKEAPEIAKLTEKLVTPDCRNYRDFVRQGELYAILTNRLKDAAVKNTDSKTPDAWKRDKAMLQMAPRAVESLFKAKELDPQAEEAWVALVRLIVDIGQPDNAKKVLVEAERTLKSDKALATIGTCYEAINEPDKAEEKYQAAVKAFPQDCGKLQLLANFYLRTGRLALAEQQLRGIIAIQTPATLGYACWARRRLATIRLAAISRNRNDIESLRQGLELLDENLSSQAKTSEDKRMKISFLLADWRKEKLNDAIALQEELVHEDLKYEQLTGKRFPQSAADQFTLAQLYARKGSGEADDAQKNQFKAAYEEQMRAVLASPHVQPVHYISYIYALLDRNEFEDAYHWLETLEKSAPNSFDTLRTRCEYLFRRGQYRDITDGAQRYVENFDTKSPDRGRQFLLVAKLLEGYASRLKADKRPEAANFEAGAERLYASLRNIAADGNFLWIQFCARQGRIDEALSVLQQCWDKDHPEQFQSAAASIIGSSAANGQQLAQMETFLNSVLKSGRSNVVLMTLSALHERRRQYDKAIENYREILTRDPRDFGVLNNLGIALVQNGGDPEEALKCVNQALEIGGPMGAILDSRAMVYIERKEYDKALKDINAAIQNDGSAEQYFHQAWVLYLLERRSDAAAALKKAEAEHLDPNLLSPKETDAYNRLKSVL